MSLTDLKKQPKKPRQRKKLSIDQFIDDADNYAQGKQSLSQTVTATAKSTTNFRHCTFTFDAVAIEQLQQAAEQHKVAKSKLLRLLLGQFSCLDDKQQKDLLKKYQSS